MTTYYNSRLLSIYKNDDYKYYNQYLEDLFTLPGELKQVKINNTKKININTNIESLNISNSVAIVCHHINYILKDQNINLN